MDGCRVPDSNVPGKRAGPCIEERTRINLNSYLASTIQPSLMLAGAAMQHQEFLEKLNTIQWRKPTTLTSEAEALVDSFLAKMARVIRTLREQSKGTVEDAFVQALTAGGNAPKHPELVELLYGQTQFDNAGVRETIIYPIMSCLLWDEDPVCGQLENPW